MVLVRASASLELCESRRYRGLLPNHNRSAMKKLLTSLLPLLLLLTSCVSAPEHIVLDAPPASLEWAEGNGQAEVVVVRKGISAFGIWFGVELDGETKGRVGPNDFVRIVVDPGTVHVGARGEAVCTATFPVEANRSYYLRASPTMGWGYSRVQLTLLDPSKGKEYRAACDDQTWIPEDIAEPEEVQP